MASQKAGRFLGRRILVLAGAACLALAVGGCLNVIAANDRIGPSSARDFQEGQEPVPLDLRFSHDYQPGTRDRNGQQLGGTEIISLVAHKGLLWAAAGSVSSWTAPPFRPVPPGSQVIVKRTSTGPWEVDLDLGLDYLRAASMASVRFTTDRRGRKLSEPAEVLLVGAGARTFRPRAAEVWSRNDATGRWSRMVVTASIRSVTGRIDPEVRILFDHVDRVTGVHHVFAGVASGTIYRGAYDPSVSGRIVWEEEPDFDGRIRRPMAAAEANGTLYLTVDPEPSQPRNGGMFRRVDGAKPRWEWIYEWAWSSPNPKMPVWTEVLLGAREQPGVIERVDPSRNHTVALEFDARSYFSKLWYRGYLYREVTLIAYNDMTPAIHPKTGQPIHLIGLWVLHPERRSELGASSWYLVRYRDGTYSHGRVFDPEDSTARGRGGLRGTRTIVVSPFAEDRGRVFYFGGFDAYGGPHQNTAWIYKATATVPE